MRVACCSMRVLRVLVLRVAPMLVAAFSLFFLKRKDIKGSREHGLPSGFYVQIENMENEKWFMRIEKGHVIDANSDDPKLASAFWCEPNSVSKLSKEYRAPQLCEIKTIMDAGTYGKFKKMLENK